MRPASGGKDASVLCWIASGCLSGSRCLARCALPFITIVTFPPVLGVMSFPYPLQFQPHRTYARIDRLDWLIELRCSAILPDRRAGCVSPAPTAYFVSLASLCGPLR